jgi:hypothetical protein
VYRSLGLSEVAEEDECHETSAWALAKAKAHMPLSKEGLATMLDAAPRPTEAEFADVASLVDEQEGFEGEGGEGGARRRFWRLAVYAMLHHHGSMTTWKADVWKCVHATRVHLART